MPHNLIGNHVILILRDLIHRDSCSSLFLRFVIFSFIFFPELTSSSGRYIVLTSPPYVENSAYENKSEIVFCLFLV